MHSRRNKKRPCGPCLEILEPRVLYSADLLGGLLLPAVLDSSATVAASDLSDPDVNQARMTPDATTGIKNNAPVASPGPFNSSQLEDVINDGGLDLHFVGVSATDADAGASISGYVIDVDQSTAAQGHYEYTTDGGANWFDVGSVSSSSALVLPSAAGSTLVRFVPAFDYNGTVGALEVHVLDDSYSGAFTSGATRATADTTTGGGPSAISANASVLEFSVLAAADPVDISALPEVFTTPLAATLSQPDDLAYGDFDGDGDQDLVVTSSTASSVVIIWNDGANSVQVILPPNAPIKPTVVDYDGDGDLDIAMIGQPTTGVVPVIYENDGSGTFTIHPLNFVLTNTSQNNSADIVFAHVDNDNLLDLVLSTPATNELHYYQQLATGFDTTAMAILPQAASAFDGASELAAAENIVNGTVDFFLATPGNGQIVGFETDVVAGTRTQVQLEADPSIHELELADLNGDGMLDIIWGGDDLVWMESNASGTGYTSYRIDSGLGPNWNLSVFDQDADGAADIVTADETTGEVRVYRNDGAGIFARVHLSNSMGSPTSVDFVDIEGDNAPELLITDAAAGSIEVVQDVAFAGFVRLETFQDTSIAIPTVTADSSGISADRIEVLLLAANGTIEIGNSTGLSFSSGSAAAGTLKLFSGSFSEVNAALSSMTFNPDSGFTGYAGVSVKLQAYNNGVADPNDSKEEFTIVVGSDTRPVIAPALLADIAEDTIGAPGATVSSLFGPGFSDPDPLASLAGVIIFDSAGVAGSSSAGNWQYSVDNGLSWTDISFVNDLGLVLERQSSLRFEPAADFSGNAPTLSVLGLDNTYAGAYTTASGTIYLDTTTNTDPSRSLLPTTLDTTITPLNDSPQSQAASLFGVTEDSTNPPGVPITNLFGGNFVDADLNDTFRAIAIVENNADSVLTGSWQYSSDNGSTWWDIGTVSTSSALMVSPTDRLRFLPAPDYFGTPPIIRLHVLDSTTTELLSSGPAQVFADVTINGGSSGISDNSYFLTTGISPVNDPPIAITDNFAVFEGGTLTANLALNDIDVDNDPLTTSLLNGPLAGTVSVLADGSFSYIHYDSAITTDSFTYQLTEPSSSFSIGVVNLSIVPVNDAPVILDATLVGIDEDNNNPPGETVTALFGAGFTDSDLASQFSGIAILSNTANATTEGSWQYSTDGGTIWFNVGNINSPGALVLAPSDMLRFMPVANYHGVPANLLMHGLDNTFTGVFTSGATREYIADVSINGGSTPISATAAFLSTAVNPINDPPTVVAENVATFEGGTITGNVSANDSDIDGDALTTSILSNPVSGTVALQSSGSFIYVHDGSNSSSDSFSYVQSDGAGGSTNGTVTISITAVNDAPTLQSAALTGISEDNINPPGESISALFGGSFTDTDPAAQFAGIAISANTANANNEGSWQYSTDNGSSWFNVGAINAPTALVLAPADRLRFVPVADYNGVPPNLSLHALDNTFGGQFTNHATREYLADVSINGDSTSISDTAVFLSTTVNPLNDPPVALADTITLLEGGTISGDVSSNDTDIDDASLQYSILTNPLNGTVSMTPGGLFTYTHDNSNTLADTFSYSVSDSQGATDTAFVVVDVIAVNDAPSINLNNQVLQIAENAPLAGGIKVADIVVTDDGLGSNQLTLSGADAGIFQLIGNELYLAPTTVLDFQSQPILTVAVNVEDPSLGLGINDSTSFQLQIIETNQPPSVALNNQLNSLVENTQTAAPLTVADIVITDDALGNNQLQLSGADAALFQIAGTELQLVSGAVLDFESQAALVVTVNVEDTAFGMGVNDTVTHTLQISDSNEAPGISLSNTLTSLNESTLVSSALKVADIMITDDALGTNNLLLGGTDANVFQIVGSELYLSAGFTPDFETLNQLDVTVSVDDPLIGTGTDDSAAYTLQILDSNEPPGIALANTITSLAESTDTTTPIKIADIIISDDNPGTNVLALSGTDASDFQLVGDELWLAPSALLDYENDPQLIVTVTVDDASIGTTVDAAVNHSITILDTNEQPSVWLINTLTALPEDTDVSNPVRVADIVITDDAIGVNELVISGTHASLFEISGNGLFLSAGVALDFETLAQLTVNVSVDDAQIGTGVESTTTHTLQVLDRNEPPQVWLINALPSLPENADTSNPIKIADIVLVDDALGMANLQLTGNDASLFQITGNELFLVAGAVLDNDALDTLSFSIAVDDPTIGTNIEDSDSATLSVTDVLEAPVLMSIEPVAAMFVENDVPVAITDTLLALAPENGTLSSATAAIVNGYHANQDHLIINQSLIDNLMNQAIAGAPVLATDYNTDTGVLTINGQATAADYLQLLRGIEYVNTSEDPSSDLRLVEITVNDANLTSNVVQRELAVLPVNDLPTPINIPAISLGAGESVALAVSELLSTDADHSNQNLTYSVIEPAPGIEVLLNGAPVSVFTQSDIDAGMISFIHDGSDASGGDLFLEVADNSGGMTGITIPISVTLAPAPEPEPEPEPEVQEVQEAPVPAAPAAPAAPELGAAIETIEAIETVETIGSVETIEAVEPEPFIIETITSGSQYLTESSAYTVVTITNITEQFNATDSNSSDEEESQSDTQSTSTDVMESALENLVDEEDEATETPMENGLVETNSIEGEFGLLASLQLPTLPFKVELFQQSPLVAEMSETLSDRADNEKLTVEQRNQVFASLLELNPVKVAVNSKEWIAWQSENGGFERSLDVLDEAFKEAASEIDQEGVVPDAIIGTSIGLTTGFLVWLLRGGTLLASLMSVAPVWKQLDPLPILTSDISTTHADDEDDEVESLFSEKKKNSAKNKNG